jgi:hypothetical protein
MMHPVGRVSGCRLRIAACTAFLWGLSGCHSTPVSGPAPPEPAPAAHNPQPLSSADNPSDHSIDVPIETPIQTPIVEPPCLPPEPVAQLKRRPKPKPEEPAPTAPSSGAGAASGPPGASDAGVKSLDSSMVSVLGKKVQGEKGEDLGRVVDVLVDGSGRMRLAVVEFGGFLGVGNRRIAVDWSLLRFHPDDQDEPLTLSVSRNKLQSVPEYKNSNHPQALMAPQAPAATPTPSAAESKK